MFLLLTVVTAMSVIGDGKVADGLYKDLPPIFHIDDYEKCKVENKLFCKVSIIMTPTNIENTSYYWQIIERSIADKEVYNHNELFHAICVNDFCPGMKMNHNQDVWITALSNCYTKKYEYLGLKAHVLHSSCTNNDTGFQAGFIDFVWLFLVAVYSLYIIFSFILDYLYRYKSIKNKYISNHFVETYIIPFSPISNWKKLQDTSKKEDFQKLKCIQGIRFYNMVLIIFSHTFLSYIGGYVMNTDYIEDIRNNSLKLGLRNLFLFLVQTFFLFSAFFLSYHTFQIMNSNKTYSRNYILLMFLNRYLRIIPPVLFVLGSLCTVWFVKFHGPVKDLYIDFEYEKCVKNWWTVLLFMNNHYNLNNMCFISTWYLSADTQLYLLSLIILSVIWKYRQKTTQIFAVSVLIGILIPALVSYTYNLDILCRMTPENCKHKKVRSFEFNTIYSSTYSNMATYMVGLCIGYVYFMNENKKIFRTMFHKFLWYLAITGLPLLVIVISTHSYGKLLSAILSGILRPLYALGIGIGILGMSQKAGGIVRHICEWKPAVFMGKFAYSTYVVHFLIVFYRTATAKQPLYLSDYVLISSFIWDVVLSFLCGFLMYIFVEMPALQLQNNLVPQVRRYRTSADGKHN